MNSDKDEIAVKASTSGTSPNLKLPEASEIMHEPFFPNTTIHFPLDAAGNFPPKPVAALDSTFWSDLHQELTSKANDEEKMQTLIQFAQKDCIIPKTKWTSTRPPKGLGHELQDLFYKMTSADLTELGPHARGKLLHIRNKFDIQFPPDKEFILNVPMDSYDEQLLIHRMEQFIRRIEERTQGQINSGEGTDILQKLIPKQYIDETGITRYRGDTLTGPEKKRIMQILVKDCAEILGVEPIPTVTLGDFKTTHFATGIIPASIVFRDDALISMKDIIDAVSHEVTHAYQYDRRSRMHSSQTPSFRSSISWKKRRDRRKKFNKGEKYKWNLVNIANFGADIRGDQKNHLTIGEKEAYTAAAAAATIYLEKSKILNPSVNGIQQGLLSQYSDPKDSKGDLLQSIGMFIEEKMGLTLRKIVSRPGFMAVEGEKVLSEVDAFQMLETIHTFGDAAKDNLSVAVREGLIARWPDLLKKANDRDDPTYAQCRLILEVISFHDIYESLIKDERISDGFLDHLTDRNAF